MDPETDRLARAAVDGGALGTVSAQAHRRRAARPAGRSRGAKGRGAAARPRASTAACTPSSRSMRTWSPPPSLGAAAIGANRALSALAALCSAAPAELDMWLADLGLPAAQRDAVSRASRMGTAAGRRPPRARAHPVGAGGAAGERAARGARDGARVGRSAGPRAALGERAVAGAARDRPATTSWPRACPRGRPWAAPSRRR